MQKFWVGLEVIQYAGIAALSFNRATRNNKEGPAGFGYALVKTAPNKTLIHMAMGTLVQTIKWSIMRYWRV